MPKRVSKSSATYAYGPGHNKRGKVTNKVTDYTASEFKKKKKTLTDVVGVEFIGNTIRVKQERHERTR